MKVAICYSGQPRSCTSTFQNHKKYLFNFFETNNIEVYTFAHFWSSCAKSDSLSQSRINYDEDNVEVFKQLWNPIRLVEENQRTFDNNYTPDPRFPHPVQNIFSMFYSISTSWELANNYQCQNSFSFDLVIRIRSDLYFQGRPFGLKDINKMNSIFIISDPQRHTTYSVGDIFAIGPLASMNTYMNLYSNLDTMICEGAAINPECLLGYWLMHNNLNISFMPLNHILYRDVGTVYAYKAYFANLTKKIYLKLIKNSPLRS